MFVPGAYLLATSATTTNKNTNATTATTTTTTPSPSCGNELIVVHVRRMRRRIHGYTSLGAHTTTGINVVVVGVCAFDQQMADLADAAHKNYQKFSVTDAAMQAACARQAI